MRHYMFHGVTETSEPESNESSSLENTNWSHYLPMSSKPIALARNTEDYGQPAILCRSYCYWVVVCPRCPR